MELSLRGQPQQCHGVHVELREHWQPQQCRVVPLDGFLLGRVKMNLNRGVLPALRQRSSSAGVKIAVGIISGDRMGLRKEFN